MEDINKKTQQILNDEYRQEHPEIASYSDEEIAQMNPATEQDVEIFQFLSRQAMQNKVNQIESEIRELQAELDYNLAKIADPTTFYQEANELRSDNVVILRKINDLFKKKNEIIEGKEITDESRGR